MQTFLWSLPTRLIPNSVKTIGKSFFEDSISLEEVKLSNKLKVIKSRTFAGCRSLKSVEIPKKVKKIEEDVFSRSSKCKLKCPCNRFSLGAKAINGVEQ